MTVLGVTVLRATASVDTFMQVIAKYVVIQADHDAQSR